MKSSTNTNVDTWIYKVKHKRRMRIMTPTENLSMNCTMLLQDKDHPLLSRPPRKRKNLNTHNQTERSNKYHILYICIRSSIYMYFFFFIKLYISTSSTVFYQLFTTICNHSLSLSLSLSLSYLNSIHQRFGENVDSRSK